MFYDTLQRGKKATNTFYTCMHTILQCSYGNPSLPLEVESIYSPLDSGPVLYFL